MTHKNNIYKERYVKPEMRVDEFVMAQSILASSGPGGEDSGPIEGVPINPDPGEAATNERRGQWGNLWAEDAGETASRW